MHAFQHSTVRLRPYAITVRCSPRGLRAHIRHYIPLSDIQPTPAVQEFISRLASFPPGPRATIREALKPALDDEAELRALFAQDRNNMRLEDPYVGLLDVFNTPHHVRLARARVVQGSEDLSAKYVFPLSEATRRNDGEPCIVDGIDEFKKNWAIFTEGSLSRLWDWNNIVAAGGSVLACLTPLEEASKVSKRAMRKHYHHRAYPSSDIDLFLWGLTPEQAEVKIQAIYEAVCDSVPWDVTCIRTKHTVSIHSRYPFRSVQIILRLYRSPAEILAGFDIDAPSCAYDGTRVWANPRAVAAMISQCNTVDMARRSPSYEVRLAKYAKRGFEIYVPDLRREDANPAIFERSITKMTGLGLLLVLEHLSTTVARDIFLQSRWTLRGRSLIPELCDRNMDHRRKYWGDLKADEMSSGLVLNDYDSATNLHVPYGPEWDAARITKLAYLTDFGMNSTFNPKNKGRRLHRHPAFFGAIQDCLEDCCGTCPEPIDEKERNAQAKEDESYIRGRIKFVEENPGRQSISGSFNPIDAGEWGEQAYVTPTQQLFVAIAAHETSTVQKLIADGIDVNQRDHLGRPALHVAILAGAPIEIADALIDAGVRISARLLDGRAPLHLAARYDRVDIVEKLFERNAKNVAQEEAKNPEEEGIDDANGQGKTSLERTSFSHEDHEDSDPADSPSGSLDQIANENEHPDIINVNLRDWHFGFSALSHAILFASMPLVEILVKEGADIKKPTRPLRQTGLKPMHPLSLTILREEEEEACRIAELLIKAGATCSAADDNMWTIFHSVVSSGKAKLLAQILKSDPHAASMLNFPSFKGDEVIFPVVTAINKQNYAALAVLLAHNVNLAFDEADIIRAKNAGSYHELHLSDFMKNYVQLAHQCVEVAVANNDDVIRPLLALGAPSSLAIKDALQSNIANYKKRTILDWVKFALNVLNGQIKEAGGSAAAIPVKQDTSDSPWKSFFYAWRKSVVNGMENMETETEQPEEQDKSKNQELRDTKKYLGEVKRLLNARGAKTWKAAYPQIKSTASSRARVPDTSDRDPVDDGSYAYIAKDFNVQWVPQHLVSAYDELYEACFTGDNDKVMQLCMPDEKAQGKEDAMALNIFVRRVTSENKWRTDEGCSPLFAAVAGKQWPTAKLVMSIAYAQYKPENPKEMGSRNSDITLNGEMESSNEDDDIYADSGMTAEQKVDFLDVALKASSVQSRINPHELFVLKFDYGKTPYEKHNLLTKAVIDGDLDTFIRIADLCQSLPRPLDLNENVLHSIILYDQPEILDELIRRTGSGINMADVQEGNEGEDTPPFKAMNDKNRIYLGLNIHGKKRADLAITDDGPNDSTESRQHPILWRAIKHSAKGIIEYLAGDQPIAAYRQYAFTHTDEHAVRLGRTMNLEKKLSIWLGWTIDAIGHSPLIIAALSKDVETLKLLFTKAPQFMETTIHKKISILGYNPLMFAVSMSCGPEFIDFLLEKSVSPIERDLTLGWTIYHHICRHNNLELLDHLLNKLPRDLNETLLVQQSTSRLETPLQIAVKNKNKTLVQRIIEYSPKSTFLRNANGSTPLHNSVQQGLPEITKTLLPVISNEALQMEDSVGNTVLEIISLLDLNKRHDWRYRAPIYYKEYQHPSPAKIDPGRINGFKPRYNKTTIDRVEEELPKLREIITNILLEEGTKRRKKVIREFNTFVTMLDARLTKEKAAYEAQVGERMEQGGNDGKGEKDQKDLRATFLSICQAVSTRPAKRQLIRVADVQKSVTADLERAAEKPNTSGYDEQYSRWLDEEVNEAEDNLEEAFARSMLGFITVTEE